MEITKYGAEVLRKVAEPVEKIDDEIKKIVNDMIESMYRNEGIGIAAPQIGVSKQIIAIDINPSDPSSKPIVLFNPRIIEKQGEVSAEEGCLSIPDVRGDVKRAEKIVVEAMDINGNQVRIEATDLLSRVLQHEIDHLNGKLIIDHLSRIKQQLLKKQLQKIKEQSQQKGS